ncbi:MAG: glycosyltransferase family 4 protein [Chitinophagaceae bacterium]|nr:glycosyltransferase family 4 protein [Chitinophagaceae bacterium]
MPLVVMEMMARGKIVISTAVDGIPDYITHKQNGLLLFKKNENDIVTEAIEAITELSNNDTLKETLRKNAYEFARQKFSYEEFNRFYKKILSN